MYSPLTNTLIDALRSLPGIGPKSAQRLTYQLLTDKGKPKAAALSEALAKAVALVGQCTRCRHFTEQPLCTLCNNPKRNQTLLCVVESPADVVALEQTHAFNGCYYVLHGHLSPLDGITPEIIGIPQLLTRLQNEVIEEVILATNPTIEGKATAQYLAHHIDTQKIKCTRIAHGVPIGGELEYLDGSTLSHAFYSRQLISEMR